MSRSAPTSHNRAVWSSLHLDRILLETDAPWLTPVPEKGQRNDPTRMKYVVARLAEAQGSTEAEVVRVTTENTARLASGFGGYGNENRLHTLACRFRLVQGTEER